ncbi:MAG: 2'-5' RNA ligase family protein [Chloroflexota bacterium]|jgi:2'-5' RNA ligase
MNATTATPVVSQYGIVYLLPPPAAARHQQLFETIEARFGLTGRTRPNAPAHLTLKYCFEVADVKPVIDTLADFAATERPAPWRLEGFAAFSDGDQPTIFIDVRPSAAVRAAHGRLLDRLRAFDWMEWQRYDGPNLHFHATLAHRGLTPKNFDAVWHFVNELEPPRFELVFDNVALLLIENDIHTVYRRFEMENTGG